MCRVVRYSCVSGVHFSHMLLIVVCKLRCIPYVLNEGTVSV